MVLKTRSLYMYVISLVLIVIGGALLVAGLAMFAVYRQKSRVSQTPKTTESTQSFR